MDLSSYSSTILNIYYFLCCQFFNQPHFGTGYQLASIHQNQHALVQRAETDQIIGIQCTSYFRCRLDLPWYQRNHIGYAIDHHSHHAAVYVEDDDNRELVVSRRTEIELDAHIDDRHDNASQIDHSLDELRGIGDVRHGIVAEQFLNLLDINAVFFLAQGKSKKFQRCRRCGI